MPRRLLVAVGCALLLGGCAGSGRSGFEFSDRSDAAPMGLSSPPEQPIRFYLDDQKRIAFFQERIAQGLPLGPDGHLDFVALSGGGANGAFTAGLMAGWTESGRRPDMEFVTGVSTGALAAPFVFLGSDWDDELREAYTGGAASRLLRPQGLGALFGAGIYRARPLRELGRKLRRRPPVAGRRGRGRQGAGPAGRDHRPGFAAGGQLGPRRGGDARRPGSAGAVQDGADRFG